MDYQTSGWLHVENYIPTQDVIALREICLEAKNNHTAGPSEFKGIQCAAKLYPELWKYYTSEYMFDLANSLLNTDVPYIFNDQIVVKMPNEDFQFLSHYDNQYRTSDGIETVNCCLILDDFTKENGSLQILSKDTDTWQKIFPKAGDVIAINGNTVHKSGRNLSNRPRCLYACVYAEKPIYFDEFYSEKLVIYDK